ncbi:hypothetical protein VTP01DRAFT_9243 [Rhizomucor pusillus]|uniref:uncharacterized protein n=1 Tax=Rhizomucor pusillus TaxID=4840 RepID=UPI0037448053
MSTDNEEKIEQNRYEDNSTTVEDGIRDSKQETFHKKSKAEKSLQRKIDLLFLPLVLCIIMVQFADKSALAISAILGFYQDTGISGSQFSWLGSIFYLGYLIYQVPNQFFVQWFPIGRYLGVCIIIWGIVMLCIAVGQTFSQLAGLRFLLGIFEASCLPCIYMIVANLYRRQDHAFYFSVITMCQGLGGMLADFVTAGIANMGNQQGIMMWRWNHIIFGAVTVALGILSFFFLMDDPKSKLLRLTPEQETIVDERTRDNAVIRSRKFNPKHALEALSEPRYYLIALGMISSNLQVGGLVIFGAQFLQSLGDFTATATIFLKVPGGVMGVIFTLAAGLISRRTQQIMYTGILMSMISLAGCLVLACVPTGAVKLLGYYLSAGMGGAMALFPATTGSNVSGYSKKIFYNATLVAAATVGQFIGPLVMLEREKPRYLTGMIVFVVGDVVTIACFIILRILMVRENKRRIANPSSQTYDVNLGLTDREDRNFLYKL